MANSAFSALITATGTASQVDVTPGLYPIYSISANPILPGTAGTTLPGGTTAQRAGAAGTIRFNSQTVEMEGTLDGVTWFTFIDAAGPILSITGTPNQINITPGPNPVVSLAAVITGITSVTTGNMTLQSSGLTSTADIFFVAGGGLGVGVTAGQFGLGTATPLVFYNVANTFATSFTANPAIVSSANYTWPLGLPPVNGAVLTGTMAGGMDWSTVAFPTFPLSLALGGTNANLTASLGGVFYSTATAGAILAGTATARQMLQSGASGAPAWSTTTWPATTTINRLLYSSAANVISDLATANSAVLITSAGGVPSLSTTLPSGISATSMILTTPTLGVASATSINFGGTALANYVEGTWTPVFTSSGGGSATYALQLGSYTRIGNRVYFDCVLVLTGLPSAGTVTITGLPITSSATFYSSPSVYATSLNVAVTSPLIATVNPSSTVINLFTFATGSTAGLTVANSSAATTLIISGFYHT